jgi:RING-H2 zinc finger domain
MTALYRFSLMLKSFLLLTIAACSTFLLCKSYLNSNWESDRSVGFSQKTRCDALDARYSVSDTKAFYTPSLYVNLPLVYVQPHKTRDVCFDEQDLSNCALILNIFTENEFTSRKMNEYFGDNRKYFDYNYWIIITSIMAFIFAIVFERENIQLNTDHRNVIFMARLNLALCLVTAVLSFVSACKFSTITLMECSTLQNPSTIMPFDKVDFCIRLSGCNGVVKSVVNPDDSLFRNYQQVFLLLSILLTLSSVLQIIIQRRIRGAIDQAVSPEVDVRTIGSPVPDRPVTLLEELRAAATLAVEYRPIHICQEILSKNWKQIPLHKLYTSIKFGGECTICLNPLRLGKGMTNGGCWRSTSADTPDDTLISADILYPICLLESKTRDDSQTDSNTPLLSDSPLTSARQHPRIKVRSRRDSAATPRWEANNLVVTRSFNLADNPPTVSTQSLLVNEEDRWRAHPEASGHNGIATDNESVADALPGSLARSSTLPLFMSKHSPDAVSFSTSQFATPRATPSEAAVVEATCGHTFHKSCLLEWATQRTTCPICRSELLGVSEVYLV